MLKEFKAFALRGNVVDMAVGVIIGAAFGAIVASFVGDVLTPLIGLATGGTDFANQFVVLKPGAALPGPYATLAVAKAAGAVTLNYGVLLNAVINFIIVAFCLFLVIKAMNRLKQKEVEAPAAPPAPTKEQVLLTEIRDLLARR